MNRDLKRSWWILSLVMVLLFSFSGGWVGAQEPSSEYSGEPARYVFLFIGDGMGIDHFSVTQVYLNALEEKNVGLKELSFTSFPAAGLVSTFDYGSYITDSSSAITAILTGEKTYSGVLNMLPDKSTPLVSVAEMAKEAGMKVGVVTSVSLDHATPAACYAHQPSRNNFYEIAIEATQSNFDYFGGGGFLQPRGKNNDQRDIFEIFAENGYTVVRNREDFEKLTPQSGKVVAINAVLDEDQTMPYEIDREENDLSLADFTRKGIELLDNPEGFFMLVEGGKIDWAAHANDAVTVIRDVLAFGEAIEEAIKFYQQHPEETLIVVTADHETGGLTLGFAATGYSLYPEVLQNQKMSFLEFSKVVEQYSKNIPQEKANLSDFWPQIEENFGLLDIPTPEKAELEEKAKNGDREAQAKLRLTLTDYEREELEKALVMSMQGEAPQSYGGYDPLTITLTHILNQKAGLSWTTFSHTGAPVAIFAQGVGAELFDDYFDNTEIFTKLVSVMSLEAVLVQ